MTAAGTPAMTDDRMIGMMIVGEAIPAMTGETRREMIAVMHPATILLPRVTTIALG